MKLKYFTVEKEDRNKEDVIKKMRRDLGSMRLFSYAPLVQLSGNTKILELRHNLNNDFVVKIDGPENILKELKAYFYDGGSI